MPRLPLFTRNAWLFLASVVIGGIATSILQLYFNLYVLALGLDKQALGLLAAIPSAVILVFGLPLGLLADRLGRRTALICGNIGTAVGVALEVSSAAPGVIALGLFLIGVGLAFSLLSTAPFIMQVTDQKTRTSLFSAQFGLLNLSGVVGSLLAGYLPGWFAHWLTVEPESASAYRFTLLVGGGLTLISVVPLWLIQNLPTTVVPTPLTRPSRLGAWRSLARPLIFKLFAPNFVVGFGAAILIPYMNVFFRERFAMSDEALGVLFSLSAVTTGVAILLGPRLEHWLGSKVRSVAFGQGSSLLFILFVGFWPNMWVAAGAALLRGALMNMVDPLYQAFSMEQLPDHERATVNSLQTIMWNVGWTFGPAISGFVQQRYGFAPLFITTTVLYAFATAMTYFFFHKSESDPKAFSPLPSA
jgi:MFS family permease